jgi:sirohydrochlorin ferrochelatase
VDVRDALARARARHPGVAFAQAAHLGAHPLVLQALLARARTALGAREPSHTTLVLASRGSSDASAVAECGALSAALAARLGVPAHRVGFFAVAAPALAAALASCAAAGPRTVLVVPHLLADGTLSREAREVLLPRARAATPDVEFVLADVLGPDATLARAALELAAEAAVTEAEVDVAGGGRSR